MCHGLAETRVPVPLHAEFLEELHLRGIEGEPPRRHRHQLALARPLTSLERRAIDQAMALADERIREARRTLAVLLSVPPPISDDLMSDGGSYAAVPLAHDGEPTTRPAIEKGNSVSRAYAPVACTARSRPPPRRPPISSHRLRPPTHTGVTVELARIVGADEPRQKILHSAGGPATVERDELSCHLKVH